ncbi:Sialic acid transporter NanT [Bacillus safensis subsp. safensis]
MEKKVSSKFIFFFGSFAGILFGYDIGIIAGAEGHIQEEFQLSPLWLGIVVSSLMGGAIIGSILSGLLGDKFGRIKLILVSSVIFFVGAIGSAVAPEEISLTIARIFLGTAVGTASSLVPAYMSEIRPAKIRGKLSGLNQLMIVWMYWRVRLNRAVIHPICAYKFKKTIYPMWVDGFLLKRLFELIWQ